MPAKKKPETSKTAKKQPAPTLKSSNKNKLLLAVVVLAVALVAGFFVYRSQAATHVATVVATNSLTSERNITKYRNGAFRKLSANLGKSAVDVVWIKKGYDFWMIAPTSTDGRHKACFELFLSKKATQVRLDVYRQQTATNNFQPSPYILTFNDPTKTIPAKKTLQTHCVEFYSNIKNTKAYYGVVTPIGGNVNVRKVTVIKL